MPQTKALFAEGPKRFFNKGVNGRWRDVFTEGDLALYDAKVREKFSPGLAAWLEGGRHATNDPRQLPDWPAFLNVRFRPKADVGP